MYSQICVAGTFDGLHRGHEMLLNSAFAYGKHVVIALTTDAFVERFKFPKTRKSPKLHISSFAARKQALTIWLNAHAFAGRAEILSLDDPVGPAATADYDALIVTDQNRKNGEHINVLRAQNGKTPLVLIHVPLVSAQDMNVISSTRVRKGEIDRSGRLVMPDNMRKELSKPLGSIVSHASQPAQAGLSLACVIAVGDMTTLSLLESGIKISLIIIDNMVNRKTFTDLAPALAKLHAPTRRVSSGPGYISREAISVINAWARDPHKQIVLEIKGEEDLLTLSAIAYAPVGSVLYYGQPGQGLVEVVITPEKKTQVHALLRKFEK